MTNSGETSLVHCQDAHIDELNALDGERAQFQSSIAPWAEARAKEQFSHSLDPGPVRRVASATRAARAGTVAARPAPHSLHPSGSGAIRTRCRSDAGLRRSPTAWAAGRLSAEESRRYVAPPRHRSGACRGRSTACPTRSQRSGVHRQPARPRTRSGPIARARCATAWSCRRQFRRSAP